MAHEKAVLLEIKDHVAHLTLNRPESGNGLNEDLGRDLMLAALECDENPAVRAVLIRGAGKNFCVGGDLKAFAAQGDNLPAHVKEVTTYAHAGISRLARGKAPVIAAVHGAAAGGGMSFVLAADIVIAADTARFTMAYTRAGLTPDASTSYFLPRVVGLRKALELTLLNPILSAEEARQIGIVTKVVPESQLHSEAEKLARELAQGPTLAYGRARWLLRTSWNETLESQMENESRMIAESTRSHDGREGLAAFLAKRPPQFRGN